jgi:hypothetical protein
MHPAALARDRHAGKRSQNSAEDQLEKGCFHTCDILRNKEPLEFLVDASEDGQRANPQHCSLEAEMSASAGCVDTVARLHHTRLHGQTTGRAALSYEGAPTVRELPVSD